MLYPIVLSGGSGSRLWPLSRALLPKQFLPLVSDKTMLQETVLRVSRGADIANPIVVCNVEHRFLVAEQLREANVRAHAILLEPEGRNTAPAVAVAALCAIVEDLEAILLVLPADHRIADVTAFAADVQRATGLAATGRLVTFGIRPYHPATGYGYI